MNYSCSLKVSLLDTHYGKTNVVSSNYINLLSNNIICIKNVPPSANYLKVEGQYSIELDPALCFIWCGNQECETYGIGPEKNQISILHIRKTCGFENIEIRIKV